MDLGWRCLTRHVCPSSRAVLPKGFAELGLALLLYHRFGRPSGGYGVRVPMHYLPRTVFGAEDHRNPQIAWRNVITSTNLCIGPLYPTNEGKLRGYVLRYNLEVIDFAVSIIGCAALLGLSNLLPTTHGRSKGVSEAYVFSMGEQGLHRLGVSFHELISR